MIALSGIDMAIWDALAKAVDLPLVSLLGGTPGPIRIQHKRSLAKSPWRSCTRGKGIG